MQYSFFDSTLGWFRFIAIAEGVSYLILLLIAMPLKYFWGIADAVKYTGWIHGVLFMLYGLLLLKVWRQYKWKFNRVLLAFVASLLPAGTFVLDRKLKKEQGLKIKMGSE